MATATATTTTTTSSNDDYGSDDYDDNRYLSNVESPASLVSLLAQFTSASSKFKPGKRAISNNVGVVHAGSHPVRPGSASAPSQFLL